MTEEKTPELATESTNLLIIHGHILAELMQYGRFQQFVTSNYDITVTADEIKVRENSVETAIQKMREMIDAERQPVVATATVEDIKKFG